MEGEEEKKKGDWKDVRHKRASEGKGFEIPFFRGKLGKKNQERLKKSVSGNHLCFSFRNFQSTFFRLILLFCFLLFISNFFFFFFVGKVVIKYFNR